MMYTDEQRLKFIMQDVDSYFRVKKDRWEYTVDVADENEREEPTEEDELEGFRRMVDVAMVEYNFDKKTFKG